jgi:2-phospho-L-lactate guanylyltransferase
MMHGDLPLLTSIAVERILDAGNRHQVVLAPDRHKTGTNALLCTPPAALAPCFGERSFARHLAAASAAGIEPCVMMSEELACDVDVPADVAFVRSTGRGHGHASSADRLKHRASQVE